MNTKKVKKLIIAVICIFYTICFAFPTIAEVPRTVSHDRHESGGVNIEYRGNVQIGTSYISCEIVYDVIHIDIPEDYQFCNVRLRVFDASMEESQSIRKGCEGLSVYKSGSFTLDYTKYLFEFNACGYIYSDSNI